MGIRLKHEIDCRTDCGDVNGCHARCDCVVPSVVETMGIRLKQTGPILGKSRLLHEAFELFRGLRIPA
jgi:hypothetical protein